MIAIDTSAIMAILLDEPEAEGCIAAIEAEDHILLSSATLTEILIVANRRDVGSAATALLDGLGPEIVPVTAASGRRAADAYSAWGKGLHPAGLNFGDCFAYELARNRDCPLLFVGEDFARTDVASVLPTPDLA